MVENAPVKVGIIASSAIFNLAFGIAALIVHLQYNDPALAFCGTSTYLTLTQWVEGFGIGNILIFIGTLVFTLLMEKAPVVFGLWSLVVGLFSFAWMIVGSVVLFRDNMDCANYTITRPLWQMALACVISYYISMVFNLILNAITRNALKK